MKKLTQLEERQQATHDLHVFINGDSTPVVIEPSTPTSRGWWNSRKQERKAEGVRYKFVEKLRGHRVTFCPHVTKAPLHCYTKLPVYKAH